MAFKVILLLALSIAVDGSIIPQIDTESNIKVPDIDYDDNPQYKFSYDVNDAKTGDIKNQQESRSGNVVNGQYSLVEPNGLRRTVDYKSDDHGFNVIIRRDPAVVTKTNEITDSEVNVVTTTPVPTSIVPEYEIDESEFVSPQPPIFNTDTQSSSQVNVPKQQTVIIQRPHIITAPTFLIPNILPQLISPRIIAAHPYHY